MVTPKVKPMAKGNPYMPTAGMGTTQTDEGQFWNDLAASNSSNRGPTIPNAPQGPDVLDEMGNLKSQYQVGARPDVTMKSNLPEFDTRYGGINLNKQGLEALRARALGTGDSPWAKLALEGQALDETTNRENAARQTGSAYGGAAANAAASGGLSRGAAERMASMRARDTGGAQQAVARGGASDRLGVRRQDQASRDAMLSALPGQEIQALQPEFQKAGAWASMAGQEQGRTADLDLANRTYQTSVEAGNKGGALSAMADKTKFGADRWSEMIKAYGADRTAKAIENSGKK